MAFRYPTLPTSQKKPSTTSEQLYSQHAQPQRHQPNDYQEWILFDPPHTNERTITTSTARTHTVSRSPISYSGSLESGIWSDNVFQDMEEEQAERGDGDYNDDDNDNNDDEELDSLDSHLPEFRAESLTNYETEVGPSKTVLPTHNGLGSFKLDGSGMGGNDLQEHLYKFERFNSRRVKRRRENLEHETMEKNTKVHTQEAEWLERIEVWRIEQSRALVDEIQRESRQRRYSMKSEKLGSRISIRKERATTADLKSLTEEELAQENMATLNSTADEATTTVETESFLNRITRKVIRDLIGIDENILSIIFGESQTSNMGHSCRTLAEKHQARLTSYSKCCYNYYPWEYKLLERIARELGIFTDRVSDHPAGLTYSLSPRANFPYAGLPVVPITTDEFHETPNEENINYHPKSTCSSCISVGKNLLQYHAEFQPTIPNQEKSSHLLPKTTSSGSTSKREIPPQSRSLFRRELTREEWERDLDLKMVFRYIYERVTTKFSSKSSHSENKSNNICNTNTNSLNNPRASLHAADIDIRADLTARAARVRQQHPLISEGPIKRRLRAKNRTWRVSMPAGSTAGGGGGMGVTKSAETRGMTAGGNVSGTGASISFGHRNTGRAVIGDRDKTFHSGSSRNYWDWAVSVGSSKATANGTGVMGSWGEV